MRFRLFLLAIILLLVSTSTKAIGTGSDTTCHQLIRTAIGIGSSEFYTYNSKRHIPNALIKMLSDLDETKFKIANPNKPYQETCTGQARLPFNQLIFVARLGTFCVLLYKHGGRGTNIQCVIADMEKNQTMDFCRLYMHGDVSDLEELISLLENNKYSF